MILKFIEKNGKCHYLTADEFITQKVYCKDFGKDFFKEVGDIFADYNHMVKKIQEKTEFIDRIIDWKSVTHS